MSTTPMPLIPVPSVSIVVNTVAELSTTVNDAALADGVYACMRSSGPDTIWTLSKSSSLTVDNVIVVATSSGSGRWLRVAGYAS